MLVRSVALLARILVETALILLAVGLLLLVFAYRIARRAVKSDPDRFEKTAGSAMMVLRVFEALAQKRASPPDSS